MMKVDEWYQQLKGRQREQKDLRQGSNGVPGTKGEQRRTILHNRYFKRDNIFENKTKRILD
jgi:hypothetical protein